MLVLVQYELYPEYSTVTCDMANTEDVPARCAVRPWAKRSTYIHRDFATRAREFYILSLWLAGRNPVWVYLFGPVVFSSDCISTYSRSLFIRSTGIMKGAQRAIR